MVVLLLGLAASNSMRAQLPLAGADAVPSLLVSPPAVSSLIEVKVTIWLAVPLTSNVPLTFRVPPVNLTICPAPMVSVTPAATVGEPFTT